MLRWRRDHQGGRRGMSCEEGRKEEEKRRMRERR